LDPVIAIIAPGVYVTVALVLSTRVREDRSNEMSTIKRNIGSNRIAGFFVILVRICSEYLIEILLRRITRPQELRANESELTIVRSLDTH
jgi:hypothetical protein